MKRNVLLVAIIAVALISTFFLASQKQKRANMVQQSSMPSPTTEAHEEYGEPASEEEATSFIVKVKDAKFMPDGAKIKLGTPIMFENEEKDAIEIMGNGGIITGQLKHDQKSKPATYETTGTYTYHLKSNPEVKGTVTVIK